MLQDIFNWLQSFAQSILDAVVSIFSLIGNLLSALFDLVKMLPTVISTITLSIGFLPSMLLVFASLSITVSVIMLIAGRNNN